MILAFEILCIWVALSLLAGACGLPKFYARRFAHHDRFVREGRRRF